MPYDGIEKRNRPRNIFSDNIEFCLCPPSSSSKAFIGACVNINEFGMCVYTFDVLTEGDTVEIKNALPVPYKRATVRWVKAYSGNFYKIGLMFIE